MREIQAEVLMVRRAVTKAGEYVLVHDGKAVRLLDGENTLACCPEACVMLVGTKEELVGELARLKLDTALLSADKLALDAEPVEPQAATGEEPA